MSTTGNRGNTSSAVMQQRHEAPDEFDDFPSPPWAARALCEKLLEVGFNLEERVAWEPACNRGYLVRGLRDYFGEVLCSDVRDYGFEGMDFEADFLLEWEKRPAGDIDWIITNPPFVLADEFVRMGLSLARVGVAMLVRSAFDEGQGRYEKLFKDLPEAFAFPFVERVIMHRGILRDPRVKYWDPKANEGEGKWKKPSTATAYQWLVWTNERRNSTLKSRIKPCRLDLERPGDYPHAEAAEAGDAGPLFGAAT